jgi:MFS family permease
MLVVLSERHLHLPSAGFAWLIGAIGVGALLGPFIPNALARDYRDARWLFVPYVIRGVGDALLAIAIPLPLAMLLLFVYGLNTSTGMVVFNSTVQGAVPQAVRGRVFTLLDITWNAMRLLSLALGGLIVDTLGIEPLFWMRTQGGRIDDPLLPSRGTDHRLTRSAIWRIVANHAAAASRSCPSLAVNTSHRTCSATPRHDPPPRWRGPGNHRAVAWSREHRVDQHLLPRRHGAQRAGACSHFSA